MDDLSFSAPITVLFGCFSPFLPYLSSQDSLVYICPTIRENSARYVTTRMTALTDPKYRSPRLHYNPEINIILYL